MKTHEKIHLMREQKHLTQEDMADALNMSAAGYSKIERGETRLNIPRLEQIAEIFEMDILEFIADEKKIIYQVNNNEAESNTTLTYYAAPPNNATEIEKLNLIIQHLQEKLADKELIIKQKDNEIALLKQLNAVSGSLNPEHHVSSK